MQRGDSQTYSSQQTNATVTGVGLHNVEYQPQPLFITPTALEYQPQPLILPLNLANQTYSSSVSNVEDNRYTLAQPQATPPIQIQSRPKKSKRKLEIIYPLGQKIEINEGCKYRLLLASEEAIEQFARGVNNLAANRYSGQRNYWEKKKKENPSIVVDYESVQHHVTALALSESFSSANAKALVDTSLKLEKEMPLADVITRYSKALLGPRALARQQP